ncbi:sugar kinase [Candidatus Omnitrophus magneticus]|uniref:Sugar kinase n=1 Tax=Candidatus Omnitrophus magneticus TaxID=1609969 RepID=A0A0F0CIV2_9BACT|nr:sugar kinase [Candidatus Omnitrophus magneticus]
MNDKKKLTVIGSIAFDSIETPLGSRVGLLGGSATYASISASFFTSVNIISVVGKDFTKKYCDIFENRGIDTSGMEKKDGQTFTWSARYPKNLDHAETLSTCLNVFSDFKPKVPSNVRKTDNFLLANIAPEFQNWVVNKVKPSGIVACDTMNLWINTQRKELIKLLKKTDMFFLNDAEARLLSGEANLLDSAEYIASLGVKMTIIKKGEHGSLFFKKNDLKFVIPPYFLRKIIDPTGAGDTYAGAVMGYITSKGKLTDKDLRTSLSYGSILASFSVEDFGINALANTVKAKIEQRYNILKKISGF